MAIAIIFRSSNCVNETEKEKKKRKKTRVFSLPFTSLHFTLPEFCRKFVTRGAGNGGGGRNSERSQQVSSGISVCHLRSLHPQRTTKKNWCSDVDAEREEVRGRVLEDFTTT